MNKNKSQKIVYIEDDPEMIDLVTLILNRNGYEVKGSTSGLQGLELVNKELPDLVLLDLMIPDLDGWDIFHKLQSEEKTREIPVIVITAKAQPIDQVLGLHIIKVNDYLGKPFRPNELVNSIEQVLKAKRI